jgi:hypothetical protein
MEKTHKLYAIFLEDEDLRLVKTDETYDFVSLKKHKRLYFGITNQSFEARITRHRLCAKNMDYKTSKKLYNCIRRYGFENFKKVVIRHDLTFEDAKELEICYIAKYDTFKNGLNSTKGGEGVGSGGDHPNSRPVNLLNNETGEIVSFDSIKDASTFLDISDDNISKVLTPINNIRQTFSEKYDTWFQVKYISDTTPWIDCMKTRSECERKTIIVMNVITRVSQTFDGICIAAQHFNISGSNISNVLRDINSQFTVENDRYDAQYDPPTRAWKYDIPSPQELNGIANKHAVVAYDEDGMCVYDFDSAKDAYDATGISRASISMSATHKRTYGGTYNDKKLCWEFKDPDKRATFPLRSLHGRTIVQ